MLVTCFILKCIKNTSQAIIPFGQHARNFPFETEQPQWHVRGPFERFVESPYYFESELCGGAVTVSFSKYHPWQAMQFLQRSTHFSKTSWRPFAASFRRIVEQAVFLPRSSLFVVGKAQKSRGARAGLHRLHGWVVAFLIHFSQAEYRIQSPNPDAPLRK
jgi:hypothetical protein